MILDTATVASGKGEGYKLERWGGEEEEEEEEKEKEEKEKEKEEKEEEKTKRGGE